MAPFNVLFLCTGNSARSIMAEALLRDLGDERLGAFSAGSRPLGTVHPLALEALERAGVATAGLHSKGFETFAGSTAPTLDLVITVCDRAANDPCPLWPGAPALGHWSLPDPAALTGSDAQRRRGFDATLAALCRRVAALVALPLDDLLEDTRGLGARVSAIDAAPGASQGATGHG
ncbi:MAG: arsenate reductase ArsC [Pseudomonadales bacterium]